MSAPSHQIVKDPTAKAEFIRQDYIIRDRITADGSSGFRAEPGRYHLYVSLACPWAHRALIIRHLLGLEDVVSMSVVDPVRDERGWAFHDGPDYSSDPINGFAFLSEAYLATDPSYSLGYTVPCLWDRQTRRLVSNRFDDITIDFETQFPSYQKPGAPDLYPEHLRPEIDAVNEVIYRDVNNGVYRAGFAPTQEAYDEAFDALFMRLDWLEARLSGQRYLVGGQLTEADIRLFPTLVRFDAVYHGHFKCNLRRLIEYPNLWAYTRDLYQQPGFGDTTNFDHIKRHYYMTHPGINPTRIVPRGPATDWNAPHGRDRLSLAPAAATTRSE
ncbi:MAG TPA: glutathione S-transferase family protein [Chloroflexota bacterium]|nr:glutathione S-transferase family protein [Chloroflexota bacterium]